MTDLGGEGQTFRSFARTLMDWEFPTEWVVWPPDLFALTSAVLGRTGAYRDVINQHWSEDPQWQAKCEAEAEAWLSEVSRKLAAVRPEADTDALTARADRDGIRSPADASHFHDLLTVLAGQADSMTMERLRTLKDSEACAFAEALIRVHAIADEACSGFGLLGLMQVESALAKCAANLLLTAKGSLSRLPKHAGIVLPKLRTPQQGLTLRSLSHHVTYHVSEVEVIWRTMPWPNTEENTLNVLAVPWPQSVDLSHFKPLNDTFQSVRYFNYRPAHGTAKPLPVEGVIRALAQVEQEHCPVHLLVFPESAMNIDEYRDLLALLKEAGDSQQLEHVPMLVAGIHREKEEVDINEVRLASYYAGRWYEMGQRKHHRWRLDRRQIRQYRLEGRFATARNWYEHISLSQRRLTFLAPNGWLALCPLICEDLAQLEPVSEVIRGVGPTLLVSLLADGPQLDNRWSARYASVLADDPGTSVLTLTSVGMVAQSQDIEAKKPPLPSRTHRVGLWKSPSDGWKAVDVPTDSNALLLTISAEWQQEFSADGRGDHESAASFRFEGVRPLKIQVPPPGTPPVRHAAPIKESDLQAGWGDMRELSAATFVIHTLLHLRRRTDVDRVLEWVLGSEVDAGEYPDGMGSLIRQIVFAQRNPGGAGISSRAEQEIWPTKTMKEACESIREMFAQAPGEGEDYWRVMVRQASDRLETALSPENASPTRRTDWGIAYSVLTCIHSVLERARRRRHDRHAEPVSQAQRGRGISSVPDLFRIVEDALKKYRFRPPVEEQEPAAPAAPAA
jgi:hypothetical protein